MLILNDIFLHREKYSDEMSHKEDVLGQPAITQILSKIHDKNDEEKKVIKML